MILSFQRKTLNVRLAKDKIEEENEKILSWYMKTVLHYVAYLLYVTLFKLDNEDYKNFD